MRDSSLSGKLQKAQQMAEKLEKKVREAEDMSVYDGKSRLPYLYLSESVMEASKISEQLTGHLRELVLDVSVDTKLLWQYQKEVAKIHGIGIRYQRNVICIRLPSLVPHRKSSYTDFLDRPLSAALQEWCLKQTKEGAEIPKYHHAALCFVHWYQSSAQVRDHDNLEVKHVQDILSLFFLQADDGIHLDLYHTSQNAEENATWVYLMEREHFPEWVMKQVWK